MKDTYNLDPIVRSNLDYANITYDKLFAEASKIKVQYCAALVINRAFKGKSLGCYCQELG